jgi:hypothetical protein
MSLWREYAVEPAVLCRTWAECNHVLDDIGWHRGRLIAEFPRQGWRKLFHTCLQESKETQAKKLRIVERFRQFVGTTQQERLHNGLIPTFRAYIPRNTWLESAIETHTGQPFDAVLAIDNPSNHAEVLQLDDLNDCHPLWSADSSRTIDRSMATLKKCIDLFAKLSQNLIVIDPYLDPTGDQSIVAIEAYLDSMSTDLASPRSLTLHYSRESDAQFHSSSHSKAAKAKLGGVMRSGQYVECFVWRKPQQGSTNSERFHDRFILSELGGIGIQGGAGVASESQHTSVYFLSNSACQYQLDMFDSNSPVFELLCRFEIS